MTIQLTDKNKASVRWIHGRCKVTFHSLNKAITLPVGTEVNIEMIEKLYSAYKGV